MAGERRQDNPFEEVEIEVNPFSVRTSLHALAAWHILCSVIMFTVETIRYPKIDHRVLNPSAWKGPHNSTLLSSVLTLDELGMNPINPASLLRLVICTTKLRYHQQICGTRLNRCSE